MDGGVTVMNAFAGFHPADLMLYFVTVLLFTMFTWNPVLLALSLAGGMAFVTALERPRELGRNLAFYLPLYLMIAVINPLFSHNGVTPLFFLNGNPVTLEAVLYGLDIAVMLVAVLYWFKGYSHVMTSDKFLFLFGRAIPRLALVLSTALRFVPLLKVQIRRVGRAQKAMGLYAADSYVDKVKGGLRVFLFLIAWSLENAVETGDSMRARGYGLKGRSHFSLFRFTPRDGVLLGRTLAALLVLLAGFASGAVTFVFYPRITALPVSPLAAACYAVFGVLTLLPFILEAEENAKWRYYRSKI